MGLGVIIDTFFSDKLVAKLGQELKRLQRKKDFPQVPVVTGGGGVGTGSTAQSSGNGTSSGHTPAKDQPLFSLKQVTTVCCRMMKEREEHIREEYDKVLTSKLAGASNAYTLILWLCCRPNGWSCRILIPNSENHFLHCSHCIYNNILHTQSSMMPL